MRNGLFYHRTKCCLQIFQNNSYKSRVEVVTGGGVPQFKDIQLCNSRNFLSPRLTRMRETKDRVMLFFCEATNRKIGNLHPKTTILKNLSRSTA